MYKSLLDIIGNTPLVEVKLHDNPDVKILAKLEFLNPGGSIKDRAALYMIEHAEESGELTKDKTVIEATSGNTGIGLALVCSIKGYKLVLTMSESVSLERRKILQARGAEIILTPSRLSTDGAIEEAYRLTRENPETYFNVDQFNNEANWMAHYHGTAKEILEQTDGQVSVIVATLGTSGTSMGISKKLKEVNPDIQIVGVEPFLGHKIQGLKNMKESYAPGIYDKKRLDSIVNISDDEAFDMARLLAKKGFFVGMSSGAAMVAAINAAKNIEKGTIVTIFPDSGERYLSTSLFLTEKRRGSQKFFNTLKHKKELFMPNLRGSVGIYSCGPTVHARMHLGEARRFMFSDLLCRYLEYSGYQVNHVMNITDIDDKTIDGSEKAGMELKEFTENNIVRFMEDLESLQIKPAKEFPKASEHVDDMISLTEKIVNKGLGYEKFGSVYFDISRLPSYGRLSGINLDKIKSGSTVDLDDYEKDNPRDFTLLKRSKLKDLKRGISCATTWGNTVPSWHIQCPAMAMKYLSENFDIHTSGRHLIFPHHENEI
ncbi:MAG: cysteine synthase, partial [Desulfobacteraceae bacterium]|nr:cysteine synthase [Desulfobacteraceae bacterium]